MADTIEGLQTQVAELESKVEEMEKDRDEAQTERDRFEAERNLWEEYSIELGTAFDEANERLVEIYDAVSPNAGDNRNARIDEPHRPKGI